MCLFLYLCQVFIFYKKKAKKNMILFVRTNAKRTDLPKIDKTEPIYVCERTEKMNNNKKKNYYFFFVKTTQKCFFIYFVFFNLLYIIIIIIKNAQSVKVTFINGSKKDFYQNFCTIFVLIMLKKLQKKIRALIILFLCSSNAIYLLRKKQKQKKEGRKEKKRNFTKRIALLSFLYSFTPNLNKQAIKNKKILSLSPIYKKTIFLSTTSYYEKKTLQKHY